MEGSNCEKRRGRSRRWSCIAAAFPRRAISCRNKGQGEEVLFWESGEYWSCPNSSLPQKGAFARLTLSILCQPELVPFCRMKSPPVGQPAPLQGCLSTGFQSFPISRSVTIFQLRSGSHWGFLILGSLYRIRPLFMSFFKVMKTASA